MTTKEQIYDEQIAPLLLSAGRIAEEHGIDFLACVDIAGENDPYATAEVQCIDMSKASASMRLVEFAIIARGNVDSMIFRLLKDQRGKQHNSLVLSMLERMDAATADRSAPR